MSSHSPLPETIPLEIEHVKMEKINNTPFYIYQRNEISKQVPLEDTLVWKGIGFAEKGDRENAKKVFENARYSPVAMFNLAVLCNDEKQGSGDEWMAMATKMGYPEAEYYVLLKPYRNMKDNILPSEAEMSKLRLKLHKLADRQYPLANAILGNLYYVIKDEKQAIENYEIAAKAGIENSIDNLIRLYNQNNEKRKAYAIAEQAFDVKDNQIAMNINDLLIAANYYGVGCEKNISKTFSWLKKICNNDISYSKRQWHINLAMMYYNGDGVEMDKQVAFNILRKLYYKTTSEDILIEMGYNPGSGLYYLAQLFFKSDFVEDYDKAIECFEVFIRDGGNKEHKMDALYSLGLFYFYKYYERQDFDKARSYFEQAAYLGDKRATNVLGVLYGSRTVSFYNAAKSLQCFNEVINDESGKYEKEATKAYYNLGWCYYYGLGDFSRDTKLATEYLEKALERGCSKANKTLSDKRLWIRFM